MRRVKSKEIDCLGWLGHHQRAVVRYYGQWIAVHPTQGIVASGKKLAAVESAFRKNYPNLRPFLHLVPRKDERLFVL